MTEEMSNEGFWRSVPGILTAAAGIITAVAGLIAALAQAGLFRAKAGGAAQSSPAISGRWAAEVSYPWSLTKQETFSFRVEGERVIGTATYLGHPRAIEEGRLAGNRLTFTSRAEEILGDERRAYENRYDGIVTDRGIVFVLQDTRGNGPIEFTARRSG